ncbi:helix-turn-helix domain-containing protein [Nonomuraea sp. 3-1Str]|uniref:winged helix-turn-helix domain-containing protein n=1 Tax=Nonomuraea sp. 3-1Str TaxID=2929801 RepID=UPI00285BC842|nr:helix-turn-helix domain-containing protein [Nonomuraea sp. 3-1Str]MDR8408903.1 helix-turn-helix domain-containing protein [Nonomuraea sp. 3-1Str]
MEEIYEIGDPRVLKVVAHPLRVRLLGLLRRDGPATASELGRLVGESSGSTSYHLRVLARYGFIEEDPDRRDGRERRWRARHLYTSWDNARMAATPEGWEAVRIMHARQVEMLVRAMRAFEESPDPEWLPVAGMSDHLAELPPEGVREFNQRMGELVRDVIARYADHPEARKVQLWAAAFPNETRAPMKSTDESRDGFRGECSEEDA